MKATTLIASALFATASFSFAGGEGWTNDFEAAKKQASKENKDLLIDFTGSDWCGWCIKLNEEVFKFDAFKKGVADKYVLVELDYPQGEEALAKLSDATKAQNKELQEKYQIQGFPTILLTDAEGRPYANTGYQAGGAEAYVAHLDKLREKKEARDAAFKKAEKLKGMAKAKTLFEGLQEVPEDYHVHYEGVIRTIKENDPDDSTGLIASQERAKAMIDLERKLQVAMGNKDVAEAMKLVDEFVSTHKPEGEEKQKLLAIKLNFLFSEEDYEGMETIIDEIIAIDPDSSYGKQLSGFKSGQLQELKKKAAGGE